MTFFKALAQHAKGKLRHPDIHFFFADERCVPPEHAESNFRLVREHLIDCTIVSGDQVHRIAGEQLPHVAAQDAAKGLLEVCSGMLDTVFLGMGEDGHIASLFPNDSLLESPEVYRPVFAPKPPPNRITLGLPVIARSKNVYVLASGSGKEAALKRSLAESADTPLGRLLQSRRQTVIFTNIR